MIFKRLVENFHKTFCWFSQRGFLGFGLMHLTRLQTLRLDSNKLSLVRSDELIKLTQLKSLDLSDCPIDNIDVSKCISFLLN